MDLDEALRRLYSSAPDDFLDVRKALAASVRRYGDDEAAHDIDKRRKPTLAAWMVNRLVLADETVLERLTRLGDELRATQHALDAPKLRELSTARRALVARLASEAFGFADRGQPAGTLGDEVRNTFDAAVADPGVAARLGQLQRAEQFAGFGFSDATGPPQLTLVRGGKSDHDTDDEPAPKKKSKPTAAERKHARVVDAAKETLAQAGARYDEAQERERDARDDARRAEKKLAEAKQFLELTRQEVEASRTEVKEAKAAFREARQAFDRLERESP